MYAKELFESVQASISGSSKSRADPIGKLKDRLPTRLSECYNFLARLAYREWRDTRRNEELLQVRVNVDAWLRLRPNAYGALLLDAICLFGIDRDIGAAIGALRKCEPVAGDDPTWRYSLAFLHAYREELQQAERQYTLALAKRALDTIAIEVEEFLLWVLETEPEKWQLHYCLALLNHYAKEDFGRAIEEYEAFLSKSRGMRKFRHEQGRSQSALAELRKKKQD
jgi:tetratricopeptide (TPR) repeat protein